MKIKETILALIAGLSFNCNDISTAILYEDPITYSGICRVMERQLDGFEAEGKLREIPQEIVRAKRAISLYGDIINPVSNKSGLDKKFIYALMDIESNGNERALSHVGAAGLFQLMPRTARDLKVKDRYNPELSIRGGTDYFAALIRYYGDVSMAVAAYNYGPGNLDHALSNGIWWKSHLPEETRNHIKKFQKTLSLYEKHTELFN